MRYFPFFLLLSMIIASSCTQDTIDIQPSTYLEEQEIDAFKYSIIRYAGKLPGKADHYTKFESRFDEYYKDLADQHTLVYYYPSKEEEQVIYFALSRIAPSLHLKKVVIAGKLSIVDEKITHYEEIFRTYKMPEDELLEKSALLFASMITSKDLSPYYYENSQPEEFIEFPNKEVYFDVNSRKWVSLLEDPLEPYYQLKNNPASESQ